MEDEMRKHIHFWMTDVQQEAAILWSTLTAIYYASKSSLCEWEIYQEALYGLLKEICLLKDDVDSLMDWIMRQGKEE